MGKLGGRNPFITATRRYANRVGIDTTNSTDAEVGKAVLLHFAKMVKRESMESQRLELLSNKQGRLRNR